MSAFIPLLAALGLYLIYRASPTGTAPRTPALIARLDRLALEAGLRSASGARLALAGAAGGGVTFIVVAGITSSVVLAAAFGLCALWMPVAVARSRREKRRRRFQEAWPDAIANLISAIRAGVSLPEACVALGERGPLELQGGFREFSSTYRAIGSFRAALDRLHKSLSDPVADRVIAALRLAHEVGGTDLARVLRTLADFVREDLRVRKEIEARWSWTVTAARVAAGAPWAVLLLMATRPEAAAAYNSATGAVVIAGGAATTIVGYRLMLRAARLPQERRLGT